MFSFAGCPQRDRVSKHRQAGVQSEERESEHPVRVLRRPVQRSQGAIEEHLPEGSALLGSKAIDTRHDCLREQRCPESRAFDLQCHV